MVRDGTANQYCKFSGTECVLEVLEEAYSNRNTDNRDTAEPISPYVLLNIPLDLVIAQATKSEVKDYLKDSSVNNGGNLNESPSFQFDEQWILYLADQMVTARRHRGIYGDEEANDWFNRIDQARQVVNGRIIEAVQQEFEFGSRTRRISRERFEADITADEILARSKNLARSREFDGSSGRPREFVRPAIISPASGGGRSESERAKPIGQDKSEQANSITQNLSDIENTHETDVTNAADGDFYDYDGHGESSGSDYCSIC